MARITIAALLFPAVCLLTIRAARGAEETPPTFSAPFCGIHAIYTALRIEGIEVDFRSLLRREVVSSKAGSTFADLEGAVRAEGASAQVMKNLSFADLVRIRQPAILHVRSEYDSEQFNHFVLCIGTREGGLKLYDAPSPPYAITEGELAALWDGSAMFVSKSTLDLAGGNSKPVWKLLLGAIVVGAVFGVLGFLRSSSLPLAAKLRASPVGIQMIIVVGTALAIAACFHTIAAQGLLRQARIAVTIARSRSVDQAPRIDLSESRRRMETGAILIDARDTADFAAGHLPGAVNVPPDAPKEFRRDILRGAARSIQIIVYCAGPECPHASNLANRLLRDGFTNVVIFTGGWEQWSAPGGAGTTSILETP